MKFLFDHDVPEDLSHLFRHLGHEVRLLREVLPMDVRAYQLGSALVAVEQQTADQNCFIALSSAAKSGSIVSGVSSPMLEMRNVAPLIFP